MEPEEWRSERPDLEAVTLSATIRPRDADAPPPAVFPDVDSVDVSTRTVPPLDHTTLLSPLNHSQSGTLVAHSFVTEPLVEERPESSPQLSNRASWEREELAQEEAAHALQKLGNGGTPALFEQLRELEAMLKGERERREALEEELAVERAQRQSLQTQVIAMELELDAKDQMLTEAEATVEKRDATIRVLRGEIHL